MSRAQVMEMNLKQNRNDVTAIFLREYIKSRQHFVEKMFELLTSNVKIKIFFLKYFALSLQLVMSMQMFSLEYTQVYLELVYTYNYHVGISA